MNKYTENMTNLVSSLKDSITKDGSVKDSSIPTVSAGASAKSFGQELSFLTFTIKNILDKNYQF